MPKTFFIPGDRTTETPLYDEQFLTRVFDSVTDPFAIYNRDFHIIKANKAFMDIFQITDQQFIGSFCYEIFYNRSEICENCHVEEVFRTGEPHMVEKLISLPDGRKCIWELHSYPVKDPDGVTVQAIEHGRDITVRKNLEQQLQTSKKFNEKIINSITDSLVVIDPGTHTIVQANQAFHSRVGLEPTTAVGKRCHEIMRGSRKPCGTTGMHCPLEETLHTGLSAVSDKNYPNSEGENRMLAISTYPILDNQGQVDLIIRYERDVTERRRMEEALAFRSKELQKSQHQLETLFEFSRQVSVKRSLAEVVLFIHEITRKIFPDSELLLLLMDDDGQKFLDLEECSIKVVEPLSHALQKLEQSGLVKDFVRYLQKNMEDRIVNSQQTEDIPNFLKVVSESYQSWFGLPVSIPEHCIGYMMLGFHFFYDCPRKDLQFFQTLLRQIAGNIRHLVVINKAENNLLQQETVERTFHAEIIGQSSEMQKIYELIDLVSESNATVLIAGENGTGKELVARAIHKQSHRREGPFIVANCSAYSPALLESELFGHEKGAFTGAIKTKKGRIERAIGGTLFLDEIGNIALATQILLLRFLQDHCFERVGGEETLEADVRVLAATNRDLYLEMEAGRFRDDLYYRLNVISIVLPCLRERKEDIPLLCKHFLKKYNLKEGKEIRSISPEAMQILMDYEWPGNIRQLENSISHSVILAQDQIIEKKHLPYFLKQAKVDFPATSLAENERRLIAGVLKKSNWNKHEAARSLDISRSTLYSKIRRYGLKKETSHV
ncbi:MAG: sigma-54-dependent Fis family transcriptional regulator [Deltaproteobacteria bacterium]|nr:sigma-54-dependent Fis family transcriptional regulator [Deltaproteobacteria bacterium]